MLARRILLALAALVLALLLGEGLSRVSLVLRSLPYDAGEARATIAAWREATAGFGVVPPTADGEQRTGFTDGDVIHPFFAFSRADSSEQVARVLERQAQRPEELVVVLLGGSVAAAFATHAGALLRERLLQDEGRAARGVHLVNAAQAAFKQPQQVLRLVYLLSLGLRPDVVVCIDGFNEVAVGTHNALRGTHPLHPASDKWLSLTVDQSADPLAVGRLARLVEGRERLLAALQAAEHSPRLLSALLGRRELSELERRRADWLAERRAYLAGFDATGVPTHLLGPPFPRDHELALAESVAGWARCSQLLSTLASAEGALFLHVLQPAVHDEGCKPLTDAERRDADVHASWVFAVRNGYPRLRVEAQRLAARGVHVLDATRLFADEPARIFVDAVHLGEAGNARLAAAIGDALLAALDG